MIVARDVGVDLGGRAVLRGVSVAARPGEAIALVGRNAAGKTTLLRALAGLVRLRVGSIAIDDRDVATMKPGERARRIAFVAQRPSVTAAFTVRETIELGRFALGRDRRRVDAAMETFGLCGLADRPYHALSVGQQQRTAVARAFAQAAASSALLLDEPFAAMDLAEIGRSLRAVRDHAKAGGVVIAAVHDLVQASALADRVWMLDAGSLVADGPTASVLEPSRLRAHYGIEFESTEGGAPCPRWGGG